MPKNQPTGVHPDYFCVFYFRAPAYRTQIYEHTHPQFCRFSVVLSGVAEMKWEERGKQRLLTARTGDATFWEPGAAWWAANLENPRYTSYAIETNWIPSAALPILVHDRRGLLRVLAGELLAIYLDNTLPPNRKRQFLWGYFQAFTAEYQRLAIVRSHPMAEKLRIYTGEHSNDLIRVTDLSRHFGMNKCYFFRRYKAATGRTPMADVNAIKAEMARRTILRNPNLPLKEVARRIGRSDHRQLGRLLKRYFGLRPRDLSRAILARSTAADPIRHSKTGTRAAKKQASG